MQLRGRGAALLLCTASLVTRHIPAGCVKAAAVSVH